MKKGSIALLLISLLNSASAMQQAAPALQEESPLEKIKTLAQNVHNESNLISGTSFSALIHLELFFENPERGIHCDEAHDELWRRGLIICSKDQARCFLNPDARAVWRCTDKLPDAVRDTITTLLEERARKNRDDRKKEGGQKES